ncbi:LamG-like jellyroll fold domain-containing protein [Accumulibacter sp.]|uniref:LamG-like jellyroll fold domain-containing protein n=1 Tax=Accumulibacter sp. TaxID=2053492 RepID=UPI0028792154|nr:LamG-like jellyroll fold domain-containing protein [Accumulibacter sp.]MDS4056431.1 LamG-like jellyroll fold domain-containing protein [Accumulibacter sp.]HMW55124.1 hypothetical protein [Accumulibacter sp.]HMW79203.1 hypothetical protein [Accumulibacter sp.]
MGDPYYGWLQAGLHLSGPQGGTSFPDVRGHTFARSGNVYTSQAQSRFASDGSTYFSGAAGDRLSTAASVDFILGRSLSVSFSLRPLAWPAAGTQCRLILVGWNSDASGFVIALAEDGRIGAYVPVGGRNALFSSAVATVGAWTDWEVSVFAGVATIFRNGVQTGFHAALDMPDATTTGRPIKIGGDNSGYPSVDSSYQGYMADLRYMPMAGRNCGNPAGDMTCAAPAAPFPEVLDLYPRKGRSAAPAVAVAGPLYKAVAYSRRRIAQDVENGGAGRIDGTTKNVGSPNYPVSRRVRLHRKRDGVLARETWSDAAGDYHFEHVRHDIEYVVTSHDHTGLYNAVIADAVTPVLMS